MAGIARADWQTSSSFSAIGELALAIPESANKGLKFEAVLTPELKLDLPGRSRLTLISRLRTDLFDHLEPGVPDTSTRESSNRPLYIGDRSEFELRELFWEIPVADYHLTLGKQQIVWGTADGLKVLDVVNPQSFREFILPSFDQSRIPLWAVNIETRFSDINVQMVLIPDQSYHQIPGPDAAFAFTSSRFVASSPITSRPINILPPQRPANTLKNSDLGIKFSRFWQGWDLSLLYLYHYEDIPVAYREELAGGLEVTPRFDRAHLLGTSFAKAYGDLSVRGEFAYTQGKALAVDDLSEANGVVERDVLASVIGLDWSGFEQWFVSVQLFQDRVLNNTQGLRRPRHDVMTTLYLRRRFLNDTLAIEGRWYTNMNDGDGLGRAKASYDLSDAVSVSLGVDWFYGDRDGVFGQFFDNDRLLLGLNFGF